MAKAENFYRTLGVSTAATQDEIKKAFRTNAQKYHPDMVGPSASVAERASAEEKFKQVSAAYEVLGDVMKRRDYDRLGNTRNAGGEGFRTGSAAQPRYPHWTPQHQAAMRPKVALSQLLGRASLLGVMIGAPLLCFFAMIGGATDTLWDQLNQGKALKKVQDDRKRRAAGKEKEDFEKEKEVFESRSSEGIK